MVEASWKIRWSVEIEPDEVFQQVKALVVFKEADLGQHGVLASGLL